MSDQDVVIRVEGVSKKFSRTLKQSILYGLIDISHNALGLQSLSGALRSGEFWAVHDVSFEVRRGEVLGLLGNNGSGKSTTLKMLNGIYMPDRGRIEVKGRVGALIEVGAGFHPLLSGRENVYVNGAILGMSKRQIDRRLDEIIEFAELEAFIDMPVKFYSSGMYVRLGFSVAVNAQPDVLLVDEILSVGDIAFQQKSFMKIGELLRQGTTIVFVSHNMQTVSYVCRRAILFETGNVVCAGTSSSMIQMYQQSQKRNSQAAANNAPGSKMLPLGEGILDVKLAGGSIEAIPTVKVGQTCLLEISTRPACQSMECGVAIKDLSDQELLHFRSPVRTMRANQPSVLTWYLQIPNFPVGHGPIAVSLSLWDVDHAIMLDWWYNCLHFDVQSDSIETSLLSVPASWSWSS